MDTTIVLTSEMYEEFFGCLANLKEPCTDIIVKDGIIRQRSDDQNSIFEVDLNDLLGGQVTMAISHVRDNFDLFKMFLGKEVTLKIHIDDENHPNDSWYELSDDLSRIKLDFPDEDYLQNEFVTNQELASIVTCTEDDIILETTLEKTITERIKTITANFDSHFVKMEFEGDMLSLSAVNGAKSSKMVFMENLNVEMTFDQKYYANMTKVPFLIKHDTAFTFQLFKEADEMITQNKISTSIGTVPINIYCKSHLMEEEED